MALLLHKKLGNFFFIDTERLLDTYIGHIIYAQPAVPGLGHKTRGLKPKHWDIDKAES